jgi:hypothetical protein
VQHIATATNTAHADPSMSFQTSNQCIRSLVPADSQGNTSCTHEDRSKCPQLNEGLATVTSRPTRSSYCQAKNSSLCLLQILYLIHHPVLPCPTRPLVPSPSLSPSQSSSVQTPHKTQAPTNPSITAPIPAPTCAAPPVYGATDAGLAGATPFPPIGGAAPPSGWHTSGPGQW